MTGEATAATQGAQGEDKTAEIWGYVQPDEEEAGRAADEEWYGGEYQAGGMGEDNFGLQEEAAAPEAEEDEEAWVYALGEGSGSAGALRTDAEVRRWSALAAAAAARA